MQSYTSIPTSFFFNDTAPTEIYTLSLHDALPISTQHQKNSQPGGDMELFVQEDNFVMPEKIIHNSSDRKSTRLNSSHVSISYAVFCLKKKKNNNDYITI